MDFRDLLPFIVGLLYFLFKRRSRAREVEPEPEPEPIKPRTKRTYEDRSMTFEEMVKKMLEDQQKQKEVVVVEPEPVREWNMTPSVRRAPDADLKTSSDAAVFTYDDQTEPSSKLDGLHHSIDRHLALEDDSASNIIDLRQAVVYDAILRRPDF